MMPEISILMPVRNAEVHIEEAINSILGQSFKDFELIIIDYGSTDKTLNIASSYIDSRISLIKNMSDYIKSLNRGILLSRGKFITRMDANNIMHKERLRIQLKRMNLNSDITVCSTWIKPFNNTIFIPTYEVGDGYLDEIFLEMLRGDIFNQSSSLIVNKSFLTKYKLKYQEYSYAADNKLWFEIIKCGGISYVEPQCLLNVRIPENPMLLKDIFTQTIRIKKEIIYHIIKNIENNKILINLYKNMGVLEKENVIEINTTIQFWTNLFSRENRD